MAEYGNPGGGMSDDSMYSDAPNTEEPKGSPEGDEEGKEETEQPTALLPKSILAGKQFNVGDEVVLKITAMHGDEIQVEYAPSEKKETAGPMEPTGEMGGDSEMGGMYQ